MDWTKKNSPECSSESQNTRKYGGMEAWKMEKSNKYIMAILKRFIKQIQKTQTIKEVW